MHWHEHDVLGEGVCAEILLAHLIRSIICFTIEQALDHLNLFNWYAFRRVNDPDQRQLWVRVLEVDGVIERALII